MGTKRLRQALLKHDFCGVDTCVFIYLFENHPEFADAAGMVVDNIVEGRSKGITSVLNLMEILVKPLRDGDTRLATAYEVLFRGMPNLEVYEVSIPVALKAADIRARNGLRSPDSILLATTVMNGGDVFITNEPKLKRFQDINVLVLGDYL